jgi:NDP-sugar pyrophosphorylase family protein
MIEVAGRPILEHQVGWLSGEGVTDVVFLCGYRWDVIRSHFGDGSGSGLRVHYSPEDEPLGRGGALRKASTLIPEDEELVVALNGDVITNQPLAPMLRFHRRKMAAATVMLSRLRSPFGIAHLDRGSHIVDFSEKPALPYWINAGVYVLSTDVFDLFPAKGDHEETTFPQLAREGNLLGYKSKAYWRSLDTFKDLKEAEQELRELATA